MPVGISAKFLWQTLPADTAHAQGLLSSRNIFDVQINCHPLTSPVPAGSQLGVTVGSIYVRQVDHDLLQGPLSQCTSSVGLGLPRDFASTSSETLYTWHALLLLFLVKHCTHDMHCFSTMLLLLVKRCTHMTCTTSVHTVCILRHPFSVLHTTENLLVVNWVSGRFIDCGLMCSFHLPCCRWSY